MNVTDVVFTPTLPWSVLAAVAVLALLLTGYGAWRRARGTLLRGVAFALALLALSEPTIVSEERESLPDVAAIVVDESPSQRIGDRLPAAEQALAALTAELARESNLEVRIVRAGRSTAIAGPSAETEGTRLFGALAEAFADTPRERIAGAILLTDGQVHDVPEDAARFTAPLHALLTGKPGERDRRLIVDQAPSYGIVGRTLELRLRVEDEGAPAGNRNVRVTVRKDGGERQTYIATLGTARTVPFTLDHGGQTVLEVEVEAADDELTLANNRAAIAVNGVRDRLRVLLVSGEPHPGERTWRNLLKADPSVDLVHFTILRPPEKQDGTPVRELSLIAFPVRELFEVKLKEFDLIIFDRYQRRGILPPVYLGNIADYVQNGGAVLDAAGPTFASSLGLYRTPLGEVLPGAPTGAVHEGGFKPALSGVGRRHPVTAALPGSEGTTPSWGRWFRLVEVTPERGNVLMDGARQQPLLIVDRVGKGRVAQMLSDHAWLWTRGYEGGGPQAELLRRLAHWLMKEPDLEEEQLRAVAVGDRLEVQRRSLSVEPREVTVTEPGGATRSVTMTPGPDGVARATLPISEAGLYRFDDGGKSAVAAVGALNPLEFADARSTDRLLAPIAEATRGSVRWMAGRALPDVRRVSTGATAAGHNWIGLERSDSYLVTGIAQFPLLPPLLALALLLAALAWGWRREGT